MGQMRGVRRLQYAFNEQCNVNLLNDNGIRQRLNKPEPVNLAT